MREVRKRKRFTKKEREQVWEKTEGRCYLCGKRLSLHDMQVDHVFPFIMGGSDEMENLMPVCRSCNMDKMDLPLWIYKDYINRTYDSLIHNSAAFRRLVKFGVIRKSTYGFTGFYFEQNPNDYPELVSELAAYEEAANSGLVSELGGGEKREY
jgi:hypothetical protein